MYSYIPFYIYILSCIVFLFLIPYATFFYAFGRSDSDDRMVKYSYAISFVWQLCNRY